MFTFIKKFFQCLSMWHVPGGDALDADVIIVHAAGTCDSNGNPGPTNEYLVSIVSQIHSRRPQLQIIPQGELRRSLESKIGAGHLHGNIPRQDQSQIGYLDTIDVLRMQKNVCRTYGWKRPLLVTTRPHMLRTLLAAQKMHIDVIPCEIPQAVWDPNNKQIWMRHPCVNLPRELLVRLLWLFQGKL